MTHHLVLWGGFRLEPSRLLERLSNPPASDDSPARQERADTEIARLERDLQNHGAGLGV